MRRLLWIALVLPFVPAPAFGWGCEGHEMVAMIARMHLTPATSAAVDALLNANPIDPALKRFCENRPSDPMADSATWADDAKNLEKTASWHFVDIPRMEFINNGIGPPPWCPPIGPSVDGKDRPGCITNAIEYELAILRDRTQPARERAKALRYVIHFLGDIHQPLHDIDNDDRGGNCTAMQFFDDAKTINLHSIWDYKIIERQLANQKTTEPAYAEELNRRFAVAGFLVGEKPDDPEAWAAQGHKIGAQLTYADLHPQIPLEEPGKVTCDAERDKTTALHIAIGDDYFAKAMPVIDQQLATAGIRLANLLNATLR